MLSIESLNHLTHTNKVLKKNTNMSVNFVCVCLFYKFNLFVIYGKTHIHIYIYMDIFSLNDMYKNLTKKSTLIYVPVKGCGQVHRDNGR